MRSGAVLKAETFDTELVVRIAARGDGVTASGRHIAFGVPGDAVLDDGALAPGPHHQEPPCSLFPQCGGCQLQHADDDSYRAYLVSRIATALSHHSLDTQIEDAHLSPPFSRRRASLRAVRAGGGAIVGFNSEKSHRIVDMRECHILRPELFALVDPLRTLLGKLLKPGKAAGIQLSLVDQGADIIIRGIDSDRLEAIELLTDFASRHRVARLSVDAGLGPSNIFEPEPATVTIARRTVAFPAGAFIQATADGEEALVSSVRRSVEGARLIGDLFAGLGTFALSSGAHYAAEASRDAASVLSRADPRMKVEHRDLYRRPLLAGELEGFDAIILDPPRAGAAEQVRALAHSGVSRIAYVSCNPSTFARDAKLLVDGNFILSWVRPVGQFRWSTHVELAASFSARG